MSSTKDIFIHPKALVESVALGDGTRVWAFAHVMKGATIGANCNIGDHAFIETNVRLGDDVTVKNGVSIWEGVEVGDRVFIGPNAVFTNDLRPRSKVYHAEPVCTKICDGASIGANATIKAGIRIGRFAMIGAGSVVTRDVRDFELVYGNPARSKGWVSMEGEPLTFLKNVVTSGEHSYSLQDGCVSIVEEVNQSVKLKEQRV